MFEILKQQENFFRIKAPCPLFFLHTAGFLNPGTLNTWGQVTLLLGYPVHHGMVSGVTSPYPQITTPHCLKVTENVSIHC